MRLSSLLLLLVPSALALPIAHTKRALPTQPTGVEWAGFFSGALAFPSAFAVPALLYSYITSRGYDEGLMQQRYYELQRQISRVHEENLRKGSANGAAIVPYPGSSTPPPPGTSNPPPFLSPHPPPTTPPVISQPGGSAVPMQPPQSPGNGSGHFP